MAMLHIISIHLRRLWYDVFARPTIKGDLYYRREKDQDFVSDDRSRWRVK